MIQSWKKISAVLLVFVMALSIGIAFPAKDNTANAVSCVKSWSGSNSTLSGIGYGLSWPGGNAKVTVKYKTIGTAKFRVRLSVGGSSNYTIAPNSSSTTTKTFSLGYVSKGSATLWLENLNHSNGSKVYYYYFCLYKA